VSNFITVDVSASSEVGTFGSVLAFVVQNIKSFVASLLDLFDSIPGSVFFVPEVFVVVLELVEFIDDLFMVFNNLTEV